MRKIYISFSDGNKWVTVEGDFSLWEILLNSLRHVFLLKETNSTKSLQPTQPNENDQIEQEGSNDKDT